MRVLPGGAHVWRKKALMHQQSGARQCSSGPGVCAAHMLGGSRLRCIHSWVHISACAVWRGCMRCLAGCMAVRSTCHFMCRRCVHLFVAGMDAAAAVLWSHGRHQHHCGVGLLPLRCSCTALVTLGRGGDSVDTHGGTQGSRTWISSVFFFCCWHDGMTPLVLLGAAAVMHGAEHMHVRHVRQARRARQHIRGTP